MIRALALAAGCVVAIACARGAVAAEDGVSTTSGAIAIANLDHQIAQANDDGSRIELLLARARYLGDYAALDRAVAVAETADATGEGLLRRAEARAAIHRFADALADLDAAQRAGVPASRIEPQKTPILIATARAAEAAPALEIAAESAPGYATHGALATAYAELGRYELADREYAGALAGLRTTSPFPYAWLYFARGTMWSEQAGDPARGEAFYRKALAHLPQFAAANVHLAELETARGEYAAAAERLERVLATSEEPEARALLGEIRLRGGDPAGARDIDRARRRYEALLARHPLAFADHAAEFYLGPGGDAERAWVLAELNLANRPTGRAFALANRAAAASGRDACAPALRHEFGPWPLQPCRQGPVR
ncbi:tetratricopeptide repeat protein [Luteimonas gilva]|uniref:Tetratricopeptide repeat protein n=1 Tax=Luteimonas gilva TaxID=2572684 RepID=A0A4U5JLS8_9GAMM|nr:tetratricopeptide repeat protein [Luteimonas gilva]TKR30125.1 tetratricopeptide repeat protein [Luteimonas gilva]